LQLRLPGDSEAKPQPTLRINPEGSTTVRLALVNRTDKSLRPLRTLISFPDMLQVQNPAIKDIKHSDSEDKYTITWDTPRLKPAAETVLDFELIPAPDKTLIAGGKLVAESSPRTGSDRSQSLLPYEWPLSFQTQGSDGGVFEVEASATKPDINDDNQPTLRQ